MLSATPQHDLRIPIPQRPSTRAAVSAEHHAHLAARLTTRDRWIARMLAEHRVLTSTQITQLAFPSRRATNLRLRQLYYWRVINRFQPYIGAGRAPMFYVLDVAGAHALAHEDGIDPTALKFRPEHSIGIAHSLRLAHTHGVNSVFTTLIHHARAHPDRELRAWWPESRCTATWGDIVRPDAYGRWRDHHGEIEWFLEWDTGTYPLARVAAKLTGYAQLAATSVIVTPVLLCFATARREAHARTTLAQYARGLPRPQAVPLATTSTEHLRNTTPAGPIWSPLDSTQPGRMALSELATAWPHLTALQAPRHAPSPAGSRDRPTALRPPEPMPPWQDTDLTWTC
ncbi:MAG: replication-relaxation family protein [Actinomycetota bacterium]|nr:replication-relaxation family protein [Actinomycetota bacterium]